MIATLLLSRFYQLKGWFKEQAVVKLLIVVVMLATLTGVAGAIYLLAFNFFGFLSLYDQFGRAVAQYSLNAGLLITLLLTAISAIFVNIRHLTGHHNRHLISLPISSDHLFITQIIFGALQSAWPTGLVMAPLFLAYYSGFNLAFAPIAVGMVLLTIIVISQTFGLITAVLLTGKWGHITFRTNLLLAFTGLVGVYTITRVLFPPRFFRLYDTQSWQAFQTGLMQLPINLPTSISYWLTSLVTEGISIIGLGIVVGILLISGLLLYISKNSYRLALIKGYLSPVLAGKSTQKPRSARIRLASGPYRAALKNELLWFTNASEATYLIFIGLITAFLLLIISYIPLEKATDQGWEFIAATMVFVAVSYMGLLFANRFIFPNLTKDRGKLWIVFSSPIKKITLFDVKVTVTMIALFVWIAVGFTATYIFSPSLVPSPQLFAWLLAQCLLFIFFFQFAAGTIFPAKSPHTTADLASTSLSGVTAIVVSLATTGIMARELYRWLTDGVPLSSSILVMLILAHILWVSLAYHRFTHLETA